ncbi:GlcG/HbpS family heme-binding protein [Azospirillum canadense]|uniref:GlcG/HbpS family heme-binding protein n=1 Tax=Azospirillum canadense TaxID=403962 RepID=UPI0022267D5B|nr:heme-binding protein [Azospirillum canadense]MCW2239562.1 uncharacterized protein GlcG (DUF336 family) [Azospirillum canadense]
MKAYSVIAMSAAVCLIGLGSSTASAAASAACSALPNYSTLKTALQKSIKPTGGPTNGGFDLNMWATIVDRDGIVCAVAFSGSNRGSQWPGSRVISAQKANTANAFSLDAFALSTANLYASNQPGGSLYGLQFSNPVDPVVAYTGSNDNFGTEQDPMVGKKIGGVNVFGGGLALYKGGKVLGAVGVSGDSSCADHNVAWRVRNALALGSVPGGPSSKNNDAIIYDITPASSGSQVAALVPMGAASGTSPSGFGHVQCGGKEVDVGVSIGAAVK